MRHQPQGLAVSYPCLCLTGRRLSGHTSSARTRLHCTHSTDNVGDELLLEEDLPHRYVDCRVRESNTLTSFTATRCLVETRSGRHLSLVCFFQPAVQPM
jgi:hypothetical protein